MEAKVNCTCVPSSAEKHSTARSERILLDKSIKTHTVQFMMT